ncbi:TMV resistance protein N [Spatholobus suberectus]|nr:TMV resistance protein N [Spatholobus suberectus]
MDSSSSFSKQKPQWIHDVFINFRGEDTRRNFVSYLHCAVSNAGVNTFLDEENLLKGMELKELMRAIEGSQISLVVFSKTYTKSTWCLNEIAKIIECHETYGQKVVPIFYYIDPSVVRHQIDDYGLALKARAQNLYSGGHVESVLSRWGSALTKAANFSGWDVSNHR